MALDKRRRDLNIGVDDDTIDQSGLDNDIQASASMIFIAQGNPLPEILREHVRKPVEAELRRLRAAAQSFKAEIPPSHYLEECAWKDGLDRLIREVDRQLADHATDRKADSEARDRFRKQP